MAPVLSRIASLLQPLSEFYEAEGRHLPAIEVMDGGAMPQPYRHLLVHENDMTPTLEAHCGARLHLRVLGAHAEGRELHRQVLLITDAERPLEFGAIRIQLDRFSESAQAEILEGYKPLGTILADHRIGHVCHPSAFLRVKSDDRTNAVFGLQAERDLYGRHNLLETPDGATMAEVVEILPPLE